MSAAREPRPAALEVRRGSAARRRSERLVAVLAGGIVTLNWPLLSLVADAGLVGGVPALYLYLFGAWAAIIAAAALILRGGRTGPDDGRAP